MTDSNPLFLFSFFMYSFLQKIILYLFLLAGYHAGAQVKFSAIISPAEIGKDEYAQLKLMVENAAEVKEINPPRLTDFTIVSGPNQESGMSMINGTVKKYIALSYILKPKAVGIFSIPPAMAKADGKEYKSNPVTVKVTATGSGNNSGSNALNNPFGGIDPFAEPVPQSTYRDFILRKGEDPLDKIRKNMFVKLEVDKTSCYVGEPVIATYKLYTRLKSESNMIKNPSFNGFSVLDLQQPNDMNYHIEKHGGREYNVYSIRKVQLYPLMAGNLELGLAEIENNVRFIKAEYVNKQRDQFNDMFQDFTDASIPSEGIENHTVTLQNDPVTIVAKPFPEGNKPVNFKGAVGNFVIEAKLEKDNFSTDDAGRMAIIISGAGNLQMINPPEIAWPKGIEGFESKATDELFKTTVPVSGRKIFEFPFTVAEPGTYIIPALEFSFFDSKSSKYKTISTKPLQVLVTKGSGKPKKVSTENDTAIKEPLLTQFFNNRWRVVSLFAVLIICGLIFWLKRDDKKEKQITASLQLQKKNDAEIKPAEEIIHGQINPLAIAEESLQRQDGRSFYLDLNEGLKKYLSQKFSIAPEELNKKNISEQLDKKGITNETAIQLHALMDEIEWQIYTPFVENEKMKDIYERAYDLVQLLNTYRG